MKTFLTKILILFRKKVSKFQLFESVLSVRFVWFSFSFFLFFFFFFLIAPFAFHFSRFQYAYRAMPSSLFHLMKRPRWDCGYELLFFVRTNESDRKILFWKKREGGNRIILGRKLPNSGHFYLFFFFGFNCSFHSVSVDLSMRIEWLPLWFSNWGRCEPVATVKCLRLRTKSD